MSQPAAGGKTVNLDTGSTKALNLTVLQRLDPFVEEILFTAAHVTFYEFSIDSSQWSRKDVEGSLFVVKRNAQPRFQFIVMNRRNTENLVEDLLGGFEYEVQVPYLLYRNAAQEVNGIWFYNQQDCEAVGNLFERILNAFSKVPPKAKIPCSKTNEFEELEAIPTSAVIEGPLEPPASSSSSTLDVSEDSFVNFFTGVINVGNAPVIAQLHPSAASNSLSCHTVCSIPSALADMQPVPSPLVSSTPMMPALDPSEMIVSSHNRAADLVTPSFFNSQSSSLLIPTNVASRPTAPPLYPPITMQRPYGAPLLQPFPPPAPSSSLTPVPSHGPTVTRDKVRDALLRLVQNEKFVDMVYQEMVNFHFSRQG